MENKVTANNNRFVEKVSSGETYVDKSDVALQLIQRNRFAYAEANKGAGKSLLLDTIEALFAQDFVSFSNLKIIQGVASIPFVRVIRIDGLLWNIKKGQYMSIVFSNLRHTNLVVLLDNFHAIDTEDETIKQLLLTINQNAERFRLVLILSESGRKCNAAISELKHVRNISQENYVKKAFHFSKREIKLYFEKQIELIANEMGLEGEDIYDHLFQYYSTSCCIGVSPKGLMTFFSA